jgi:hypothetical protein
MPEQSYYRWRKQYAGMSRDQLKRLKELETKNTQLTRVVSDLMLDKMILTETARGTEGPRSETSKPFLPPSMYLPCLAHSQCIRTPGLLDIGAASLDAAQGAYRPAARTTADRGHHRTDRRVRTRCTARQAIAQQSAEGGIA